MEGEGEGVGGGVGMAGRVGLGGVEGRRAKRGHTLLLLFLD